jgi:hypothetical protein
LLTVLVIIITLRMEFGSKVRWLLVKVTIHPDFPGSTRFFKAYPEIYPFYGKPTRITRFLSLGKLTFQIAILNFFLIKILGKQFWKNYR